MDSEMYLTVSSCKSILIEERNMRNISQNCVRRYMLLELGNKCKLILFGSILFCCILLILSTR